MTCYNTEQLDLFDTTWTSTQTVSLPHFIMPPPTGGRITDCTCLSVCLCIRLSHAKYSECPFMSFKVHLGLSSAIVALRPSLWVSEHVSTLDCFRMFPIVYPSLSCICHDVSLPALLWKKQPSKFRHDSRKY